MKYLTIFFTSFLLIGIVSCTSPTEPDKPVCANQDSTIVLAPDICPGLD